MKIVYAILPLILLSLAVAAVDGKSHDEMTPDELYAERLAALNKAIDKKKAEAEKMWEQHEKEEADKRHEETLRRAAARAAHETWCAEHPVECAQAQADRQREQAEQVRVLRVYEANGQQADQEQERAKAALARIAEEQAAKTRTLETLAVQQPIKPTATQQRDSDFERYGTGMPMGTAFLPGGEFAERPENALNAARTAQARAAEQARTEEQDRQQAQTLKHRLETDLFLHQSPEQLKTDLFMANGSAGPKTQRVKDQMETDLFLHQSPEQLKTDLFMLNP